jgi:hypothetical protein
MANQKRRKFLKFSSQLLLNGCTLSLIPLLKGCTAPRFISHDYNNSVIVIKKIDFLDDKYVLINEPKFRCSYILKKNKRR